MFEGFKEKIIFKKFMLFASLMDGLLIMKRWGFTALLQSFRENQ